MEVQGIPIHLLIDIFSRVPAKAIARCRCVSRLWRSILCRPDFMELFLTMSSIHRPLFFFTIEEENNLYFYSSPQPQIHTHRIVPTTRYHVQQTHTSRDYILEVGSPLHRHGFVCVPDMKRLDTVVIYNPLTGESVSLPKLEQEFQDFSLRPYLGYDPIDKQLKVVLCIGRSHQHQLLTLDNENHLWRRTQIKPHYPKSNRICIDGVLYYTVGSETYEFGLHIRVSMIMCFHIRSEKFSFINIDEEMTYSILINYKGKLAALRIIYQSPIHLEFCVLQDAEKHKWSKRFYTLPPLLSNIFAYIELQILGMTGRGDEVVLSPPSIEDPFYIYYFNLENNDTRRVQIQGLEVFKGYTINTSLDYVENLKLLFPDLRL